jgi:hypothetical protein
VQSDWLDQNKKVITGIAINTSPERVAKIAKNDSELEKVSQSQIIKIEFKGKGF